MGMTDRLSHVFSIKKLRNPLSFNYIFFFNFMLILCLNKYNIYLMFKLDFEEGEISRL